MLTLMVGISGSGKSFWANGLGSRGGYEGVVLSSDKLRALYGKDESDQSVSGQVFATMRVMTEYLINEGFHVYIDATNYHKKARKDFIAIARKLKVPVKAIVVQVDLKTAKERNLSRTRQVPEDVIDRQFNNFEMPDTTEVDELQIIDNNQDFFGNSERCC